MTKKSSPPRRREQITSSVRQTAAAALASPETAGFPIVGIGASAGGLEALEQFLGHVPTGGGLAFVIVQHLDPTRKGIMPEYLEPAAGKANWNVFAMAREGLRYELGDAFQKALRKKADEHALASNDMKNLLDSTDIATLFLDKDLHVRRFTPQATKIIKLIPADVGRPITDLVSDLNDPTLADDVREVLRTLTSIEKPVVARNGRWFTVHIMPYRTMDDRIDGVVITFMNITAAKTLEAKLRGQRASLERNVAQQDARRVMAGKSKGKK